MNYDPRCRHTVIITQKVTETRTNLVCFICDELVGCWESERKKGDEVARRASKKDIEDMKGQ